MMTSSCGGYHFSCQLNFKTYKTRNLFTQEKFVHHSLDILNFEITTYMFFLSLAIVLHVFFPSFIYNHPPMK